MKKALFILSLCAVICSGCWKHGMHADNGNDIFNSWKNSTQAVLNETVNLAFISNAWINGDDDTRRFIEDIYFPDTRIRHEGGNEYGIYRGTQQLLLINTGGKTIDEDDANWLITRYSNYDQYYSDGIRPVFLGSYNHTRLNISRQGIDKWTVKLDSVTCSGSTTDWTITVPDNEIPVSLFNTNFTLSGSGVYLFDGSAYFDNYHHVQSPVTMRYEIVTPVRQRTSDKCLFESGVVDIIVSKESYEDLSLRAEILETDQYHLVYRGKESYYTLPQ